MYLASLDLNTAVLNELTLDNRPADLEARDIALDNLLLVRGKLIRLQSTFELGKPDPKRIIDAVNKAKQTPADKNGTSHMVMGLDATQSAKAIENAKIILPDYKSKLEQCSGKITG